MNLHQNRFLIDRVTELNRKRLSKKIFLITRHQSGILGDSQIYECERELIINIFALEILH